MEINPECSLEGLMKLKLQYSGHLMLGANSLEKTLMLEKMVGGGEGGGRMRWLDSIIYIPRTCIYTDTVTFQCNVLQSVYSLFHESYFILADTRLQRQFNQFSQSIIYYALFLIIEFNFKDMTG